MGWLRRLRNTWSRRDDDFEEEHRFHIDALRERYEREGLTPEDARQAAQRQFGATSIVRERTLDADMFRWIDDLRRDIAYSGRLLLRSPGFSLLAIFCLTIGIGANAAVFSWIEGIMFRPFPLVAGQDRLVAVTSTSRGTSDRSGVSWPDWRDMERASTSIDAFIAEHITGTTLSVGDRAERVAGSMVSANYFDALGIHPILGRGFETGEDVGRNAHPVTVISYQLWRDRFHGDPAVIGRTQLLSGLPHTIVGVAPEGFYGTFVGYAFQFWVPASMQPQFDSGLYALEDRSARWIEGFVRLKPGVSIERAQADLSAIAEQLEKAYPDTNRGRGIKLWPLWQTPFNGATVLQPTLVIALLVVTAVLFIACANVGNLLLVRAFGRQRELTVRLAIGAGRARIVKQLLTEGVMLSALAGAGGLILARWLRDALVFVTPPRGVAMHLTGELDWRVFVASAVVCAAATLLFALVPALLTSKIDLAAALRAESGGVVGPRSNRVRSTLVIVQVSLSCALLIGAGLLIRSMLAVRDASPGFDAHRLVTTSVDLFTSGYDPSRAKTFQDELIDRVQAIPGVESAALSRMTPFSYRTYSTAAVAIDGYVPPPDQQPTFEYNEIGPGFLATTGIPLVAGREFTRADDERTLPVAIVDETLARQFWPGREAVGRRLQLKGQWLQVVGVAAAARYHNLLERPQPFFYVPLRQHFTATTALQVRTTASVAALAPALVREIHRLDANVSPSEVITMREQIDRTTAAQRVAVTMLVAFGGVALVLAAIGLYGVMASIVAQGRRELALRMALGAGPAELLRLVLARGLVLTTAGIVIGTGAALQFTRLLGYLLYGVGPRDPVAFVSAMLMVAVASVLACVVPGWRATRTNPLDALRG
ncbi:MAG TPA: ABC transporter permease [Vicinamibacterales bacterium]|jgi:predicted permease